MTGEIAQDQSVNSGRSNSAESKKGFSESPFKRATREALALLVWIYALLQIFVLNVDGQLLSLLPVDLHWLVDFKLIVFLVAATGVFFWLGTKCAVLWCLYIAVYPFVVLGFKLPRMLYRKESWILAVGVINAVIYFFRNLKINLLVCTLYSASIATACFANDWRLLIPAAGTLTFLICTSFVRSFWKALQSSEVLKLYSRSIKRVRDWRATMFAVDEQIRSVPVETLNTQQVELWNKNLQNSVMFNRLCLFAANRLREYQKSEWRIIPAIFGLLGLVLLSVLSFMAINFALYKIQATQFTTSETPSLFSFFFYSFNVQIFSSSPQVQATMPLSQWAFVLQSSLSLVLVLILATLVISNRAQRVSLELDTVITDFQHEAEEMEAFIRNEYRIPDISSAIEHLQNAKSEFMLFIYWLSKRIDTSR